MNWEEELLLTLIREYLRGCVIGMDDEAMGRCFVNVMVDYQEHLRDFLQRMGVKDAEGVEKKKKEKEEQLSQFVRIYREYFNNLSEEE